MSLELRDPGLVTGRDPGAPRRAARRRPRDWPGGSVGWRRCAGVVVWVAVVAPAGFAAMRLAGAERGPLVQVMAFAPYVAASSLVALAAAGYMGMRTRRWGAALVAAVTAATLVACVLPRAVPDGGSTGAAQGRGGAGAVGGGPHLRVLTSNLLFGRADAAAIVRLVRTLRVDVLAVQELTPQGNRALESAGLAALLPYRQVCASEGAGGSAVYSRLPLLDPGWREVHDGFFQARAVLTVPGAAPVEVESAHTYAPISVATVGAWRASMSAEPKATPSGTARILLGDFNATLDHAALRRLIDSGYRDAASTVGRGLSPTWPFDGQWYIPPVTIDHVLADRRIGVAGVSVHPVPRSDHRAVFAELTLPAA